MFNFLSMMGNYEARKIGRDDYPWGFISTASVTDGEHPFETAVEHKEYGDGSMVIVEAYDTREEAVAGHARWVSAMTADTLPSELKDVANSGMQKLALALGGDDNSKKRP